MKKVANLLTRAAIAVVFVCCNNSNSVEIKNNNSISAKANSGNGIIGEWERIGGGKDENSNGVLDDSELKTNDPLPGGFDYLHFYENGKCIYDKNMEFDGNYVIKMEKDRKSIFIYPGGLPSGLSAEERDKNAFILRIHSIESKKMYLKPAHLQGQIVAYKRI